jgi:hypothetical protein
LSTWITVRRAAEYGTIATTVILASTLAALGIVMYVSRVRLVKRKRQPRCSNDTQLNDWPSQDRAGPEDNTTLGPSPRTDQQKQGQRIDEFFEAKPPPVSLGAIEMRLIELRECDKCGADDGEYLVGDLILCHHDYAAQAQPTLHLAEGETAHGLGALFG